MAYVGLILNFSSEEEYSGANERFTITLASSSLGTPSSLSAVFDNGGGDYTVGNSSVLSAQIVWNEIPSGLVGASPLNIVVTNQDRAVIRVQVLAYDYELDDTSELADADISGVDINIPLSWATRTINNRLIKQNAGVSYEPGSPGVSGNPGQPYLPPRSVIRSRTVCSYKPDETTMLALGWTKVAIRDGAGNYTGDYQWIPPLGNSVDLSQGSANLLQYGGMPPPILSYQCREEFYLVTLPAQPYIPPTPAVPPTPAQTIINYNLGWNSAGHSSEMIVTDGVASFQVPADVVGAIVGLNDNPARSTGYRDIPCAIFFSGGVWDIVESGASLGTTGTYVTSDVFKIVRRNNVVTYLKNDTLIYTSGADITLPVALDVSLYSANDYVFNPSLVNENNAYLTFEPMRGSEDNMTFQPLTLQASSSAFEPMYFQPFALKSGDDYCDMYGELAPLEMRSDATVEITPNYTVATCVFAPFSLEAESLTGTVSSASLTFEPAVLKSGDDYCDMYGTLAPLTGHSSSYDLPGEMAFFSFGLSSSALTLATDVVLVFNSTGQITGVLACQLIGNSDISSTATVSDTQSLSALRDLAIYSVLAEHSANFEIDDTSEVWVMNLETGGFTRYENYSFNSYAYHDGAYYGAKADGIYRLNGDGDEGDAIQSMVSFGLQDFGSQAFKRVSNAYLGVASDGRLLMKVIVGDDEYIYEARSSSETLATQRIDLGRGLRANYLEFELYNSNGDDFELSSVEFLAVALSRRI